MEIKIESGIPMPNKIRQGHKGSNPVTQALYTAIRTCEIGDSFVVRSNAQCRCVHLFAKRVSADLKFTWRKQPDGEYRVWRIA